MSDKEDDFTRVFIWVLAILVLFTIVVMLVARSIGLDDNSGPMDMDEPTKPYNTIKVAGDEASTAPQTMPAEAAPAEPAAAEAAPAESAPAETMAAIDGQALYAACAACHASGAAGAPVVGNAAAWGPRIAAGMDSLIANAINGKGAMPPKGGRMDFSDAQVTAIVEYMAGASK